MGWAEKGPGRKGAGPGPDLLCKILPLQALRVSSSLQFSIRWGATWKSHLPGGARDYGKHWPFRLFSAFRTLRGRAARAPTEHPLPSRFSMSAERYSWFSMPTSLPSPDAPFVPFVAKTKRRFSVERFAFFRGFTGVAQPQGRAEARPSRRALRGDALLRVRSENGFRDNGLKPHCFLNRSRLSSRSLGGLGGLKRGQKRGQAPPEPQIFYYSCLRLFHNRADPPRQWLPA